MAFNPNQARDAHGRWSKMAAVGKLTDELKKMKVGDKLEIGEGSGLRVGAITNKQGGKTVRHFEVRQPGAGGPRTPYPTAEEAAKAALDHSAKQKHEKALGGKTEFKDAQRYHDIQEYHANQPDLRWHPKGDGTGGSVPTQVAAVQHAKKTQGKESADALSNKFTEAAKKKGGRLGKSEALAIANEHLGGGEKSSGGGDHLAKIDAEIATLKDQVYKDPTDGVKKKRLKFLKQRRTAMAKDPKIKGAGGEKKADSPPANETVDQFRARRRKERRLARKEKAAGGSTAKPEDGKKKGGPGTRPPKKETGASSSSSGGKTDKRETVGEKRTTKIGEAFVHHEPLRRPMRKGDHVGSVKVGDKTYSLDIAGGQAQHSWTHGGTQVDKKTGDALWALFNSKEANPDAKYKSVNNTGFTNKQAVEHLKGGSSSSGGASGKDAATKSSTQPTGTARDYANGQAKVHELSASELEKAKRTMEKTIKSLGTSKAPMTKGEQQAASGTLATAKHKLAEIQQELRRRKMKK